MGATPTGVELNSVYQGEAPSFTPSLNRNLEEVVVVDAVRTPFGRESKHGGVGPALKTLAVSRSIPKALKTLTGSGLPKGSLEQVTPIDLGAEVINALIRRNPAVDPALVEDVLFGSALEGFNPARTAVLSSNLPDETAGATVNRLCASGLEAITQGYRAIACGEAGIVIAGGLENMNAISMIQAMKSHQERFPERLRVKRNHNQLIAADRIARHYKFDRELLAQFAVESQRKYDMALRAGFYAKTLEPIHYSSSTAGEINLDHDEHPRPQVSFRGLSKLPPVPLRGNKTVTAGVSSGIVDGAAAILLMSREKAEEIGVTPRARIVASAVAGSDPDLMLTGPIYSTPKALHRAGLSVGDIDRWEINEAFASVVLAVMQELQIMPHKVNVWGGAIAHGHPLGATGAMLLGKVIDQLEQAGLRYGCVTMCVGMGQGETIIVERIQ